MPNSSDNLLYEVALSLVPGVGAVTARQLISYGGNAEAVWQMPKAKLLKIPQVGPHIARQMEAADYLTQAGRIIDEARKQKVELLSYSSAQYPKRLLHIPDAPLVLYYKGTADLNALRTVAIVGTREATAYGKLFVEKLIQDLLPYKPVIISGLAYGIDIAAHRESLRQGLTTIGIMANGIDIVYPALHKNTAQEMLQAGGLLTENPFGTKPDAARFPARNRIIAGMADAVVVVEARNKGGAIITAKVANDYHKEVFALPGNINQPASQGCNELIKTHQANLITEGQDLVMMLRWQNPTSQTNQSQTMRLPLTQLTPLEQQIISFLRSKPARKALLDELIQHTGLTLPQLSSLLLSLELQGVLCALPGQSYELL
ncbi:DNA-processing protein DprA [Eisenibacter elegans]|uniref:DNA-processing protein DprA n=1 Tax=Eisenibacter elegans TaxID=997 RepID=UPI0003FC937B|nr:DNA-processing protein DprA [Eisenibacter elegans]